MRWWSALLLLAGCASFFEKPIRPPEAKPSADRGWELLLNRSYLKVGVPVALVGAVRKPRFESDDELAPVPGRSLFNGGIPLGYSGKMFGEVPVAAENCLLCHAGPLRGHWVLGLGNSFLDATLPLDEPLGDLAKAKELGGTPDEVQVLREWLDYQRQVGPYDRAPTVGLIPALYFTGFFFSHRRPADFAWVEQPYYPMLPTPPPPTDVPAWWQMKKKQRLYLGGELTGDFRRALMQFMSPPGTRIDDLKAAERDFEDVYAALTALEPPRFPGAIDGALAHRGEALFAKHCSDCHGTYGPGGSYPSKVVSLDEVETDPARNAFMHALPFAQHYARTWYAEHSELSPSSGYVAPPLDGVWATAPYFHNGSVPTLEAVLDPSKRPKYFRRTRDSREYDLTRVGWSYELLSRGHRGEPDPKVRRDIYDTTLYGCGNGGHEFGAELEPSDRAALLEYLKTL